MSRRKKVTYRPSKAQGIFSTIWGGIFVLIGPVVVIPAIGPFGLLWTAGAAAITALNAYRAFGKRYSGPEIHIEEETVENLSGQEREAAPQTHDHIPSTALDAKERLEQLERLREAGLITGEEYRKKREEILQDL